MDRIEIPLSRSKIFLVVAGAVVFVLLGILFALRPDTFVSPILRSPQVVRMVGIATILFFGVVGVYGFRKLFDKKIGLIVDETGITDHTNASSAGLIEWADITEIASEQVMSTRFLLLYTTNPDKYLNRVTGFKRKLMQGNMKMYGTPLSITSNTVSYDFNELERLLKGRWIEHQETLANGSPMGL
ncbi:STM3941 family protein [Rufibacter latericius]|uniref:Uncharacterized protein n=1 Tax=Rufibacter latericius TaxID=2487040 RepID=A0A3M9MDJ0_9BACT|nr:STM3941 family protein [Rufibacter latericius]RNI23619.1 hypothetical protein EFB08_19020 [Rufibacter latericius]